MKTVVGLYKTMDQANKVKAALTGEGYREENITVIDQTEGSYSIASGSAGSDYTDRSDTDLGNGRGEGIGSGTSTGYNTTNKNHESIGARIKNFFTGTSGADETAHRSYTEGVANGGALLAVTVADDQAERTAQVLQQHGASEIEGGYEDSYGSTGSYEGGTYGSGAQDVAVLEGNNRSGSTGRETDEQVIPVVAEELQVGKRTVQRGGVRVYSHVVSEPVKESVSLHDERVVVDRRPVDRAATDADFNTGSGVVDVRATGEEAVVGKRSRVVEEILVGKQGSDRTEEISDSVRHTEVDVEQTDGAAANTTGGVSGAGVNRR